MFLVLKVNENNQLKVLDLCVPMLNYNCSVMLYPARWAKSPKKQSVGVYFFQHGIVF